ncbi:MAG TPA: MMPL family transporter [Thermomicrobiales bacterium]|nr:MMPL family transporter [Thermomicrobiales bacterium]
MSFLRFGHAVYRRRKVVVGLWVALVLLSLPLAPRVASVLKVGGFSSDTMEASRAVAELQRNLGYQPTTLSIIFTSQAWTVDDPRFVAAADAAVRDLKSVPQVADVVPFTANPRQVAADRHTAYTLVVLDTPDEGSQHLLPALEAKLHPTPPELRTALAGASIFYADIERTSSEDLRRGEVVAFPLALVALFLVFGSVVGALTPVVIGGCGVLAILASLFLLGHATDLSIFVLNLATMLGLGLAVDYALFITSRFREELARRPVEDAVAVTVATAGRAIFFSGLTVLIGLSALIVFPFMFLRSVGVAGVLVVFFSVLAALTLLPALLGLLGPRIDALTIIRYRGGDGSWWRRLANTVMAHPWRFFIPSLALLALLGSPFAHVRLSSPDASILPRGVPSRQGYDLLVRAFGAGELQPVVLAVRTRDGSSIFAPDNVAALYALTHALAADGRVERVDSIVTLDPRIGLPQYQLLYADPARIPDPYAGQVAQHEARGDTALVSLVLKVSPVSDEAKALVRDIRGTQPPGNLTLLVTGTTAGVMDVVGELYRDFPLALIAVVLATLVILLLLLRSVVLPIKAIVLNALSLVASYGALVWIFQDGHLSGLLGFAPLGFVEATLPIVMFCTLFGVSMDYEVFLLSRIRETYLETGDNTASVAYGLERSGRIITSAALIVVLVAGSFVTAGIVLIKALGLGVALAVLLDATVIRALLVPATMRLLGEWNWWLPGWLRRVLPHLEHHEYHEPAVAAELRNEKVEV